MSLLSVSRYLSKLLIRALDILISCALACVLLIIVGLHALFRCFNKYDGKTLQFRRLLVLDCDYTLQALRKRNQLSSILCRDLDGYFEHVWSVHLFASMLYDKSTHECYGGRFGGPVKHQIAAAHTFIEGKMGLSECLKNFQFSNFLLGQFMVYLCLRALIVKEKVSVIRVSDPFYCGLFGFVLSRVTNVPVLVRIGANHDDHYRRLGQPTMKRLFRFIAVERAVRDFLIGRFDCVAVANKNYYQYVLSHGVKPERLTLFRYGNLIDPIHYSLPASRDKPEKLLARYVQDQPFAICIGRLMPSKCPDAALGVISMLRKKGIDLKLLMVGEGGMLEELEHLAETLEIHDLVEFTGALDQDALHQLLPYATLVISPITGRALVEAALAEVPIVGYDIDWQSEVIISGKTGELVPFDDVAALGEASERLITDKVYAADLSKNLRNHVLEMMDQERLDNHERLVYSHIISGMDFDLSGLEC